MALSTGADFLGSIRQETKLLTTEGWARSSSTQTLLHGRMALVSPRSPVSGDDVGLLAGLQLRHRGPEGPLPGVGGLPERPEEAGMVGSGRAALPTAQSLSSVTLACVAGTSWEGGARRTAPSGWAEEGLQAGLLVHPHLQAACLPLCFSFRPLLPSTCCSFLCPQDSHVSQCSPQPDSPPKLFISSLPQIREHVFPKPHGNLTLRLKSQHRSPLPRPRPCPSSVWLGMCPAR